MTKKDTIALRIWLWGIKTNWIESGWASRTQWRKMLATSTLDRLAETDWLV